LGVINQGVTVMATPSAAVGGSRAGARAFRPSFFFWMTVVMAVFVFGGFGMTYLFPLASGTLRPAPPVVHLHGIVFMSWMILLLVQPALIGYRNVALHRSLGTFGIALATAIMFMGFITQMLGAAHSRESPTPNLYNGVYLGIMAVAGFGIMFSMAIRNTRRPEIHKRMILLAMLPILPPGIHRFYMVPLGLTAFPILPMYLTLDAMAAAILIHQWRSARRISGYTMFGVGWILVQQALHYPVTHSQWFADFVYALSGMMHYR
jgi:hypothetical protein